MSRVTTLVGINLSVSCCRKLLLQKPKPTTIKEDGNNWLSYNSPGFCVCKPRSFARTFCFFLVDCFGGWSQWIRLVSCRKQLMLTEGPAPDPNCQLNISSFPTLPCPLHCLINVENVAINMLLVQMMRAVGMLLVVHLC